MICNVHKDILFYALEYSLGRRTFAPTTVMENIKNNIDKFEDWELENICYRIRSHEILHGNLGEECDATAWYNFIEYLYQQMYYRSRG